MKQKISLIIIALILILPVTFYAIFKAPSSNGALSAANGKPIVLEFSTPLCSECLKLKKVLDKIEPQYNNKISFQKINAGTMNDETFEKVQKYKVKVVPTTIFIDKNGEIAARKEGSMSEDIFAAYLDELLK